MRTVTSVDVEVVDVEVEEVEEEVEEELEEELEEVTRRGLLIGTLAVVGLTVLTVSDEELSVDVGTGSPLDITLPHGSSPKAWPIQPQLERQESTQFAPLQKTFFSGCCCIELFGSLVVL